VGNMIMSAELNRTALVSGRYVNKCSLNKV
jgi:hypothetical protein